MGVFKTTIHGNSNIGIYLFTNDKFCLAGKHLTDNQKAEIERALNVPVHRISIAGTDLIGAFVAGNSRCILVPKIIFENELQELDNLGINYEVIDSDLTALGNNIMCNDEGAYVSPDYSAVTKKHIRQALGVKVVPGLLSNIDIVGSLALATNSGVIVCDEAEPEELKEVESLLNMAPVLCTINKTPYIGSSIVANTFGYVMGLDVQGDEIMIIEEALGFTK